MRGASKALITLIVLSFGSLIAFIQIARQYIKNSEGNGLSLNIPYDYLLGVLDQNVSLLYKTENEL